MISEMKMRNMRQHVLQELLDHSPEGDICSAGLWVASAIDVEIIKLHDAIMAGELITVYSDGGFQFNLNVGEQR